MRELTRDELARHVSDIAEQGFTIVEDAFPTALADRMKADLDRLEETMAIEPAGNIFEGGSTWRIYNLLVHGELYEQVPLLPAPLAVVERVLDRGCLISSLSSIVIGPGERAQPIHADDQLIPIPKPHPPTVCNTMWAVTDFTEANGATRLVPGSHLADGHPAFGVDHETIAAEMPKGSVLVWHGSLWHGGGANATDARRYGIAMNYCAGYIRQQENQQLGVPQELVRRFPTRLQELVGYGLYNGLIGHIDKQPPSVLLGEAPEGGMIWDAAKL